MRNTCAQNAKQIAKKKFPTKVREKEHKHTQVLSHLCAHIDHHIGLSLAF
jgi:hypothetical protein